MASKYWIKLYHEILDDPKMGLLPDNVWRRAIELFLLAGELDNDGQLPDTRGIAWKLRIPCNETLQKELKTLQECNILALQDDNTWLVTHFSGRQSKVEVADRVRQFRKRQREKAEKEPSKKPKEENVTKRYIDTDTDTDTDKESSPNGEGAQAPALSENPTIPENDKKVEHPSPKLKNPAQKSNKGKKPQDQQSDIPAAIKVYQVIARRLPDKAIWPEIENKVGSTPECLERWGKVITAYIGCGWNKLNLSGMLRFYEENRIPTTEPIRNGAMNGRNSKYRPTTNIQPVSQATGLGAWTVEELAELEAAGISFPNDS